MTELTDFQRFALAAIIHYDLILARRKGSPLTRADLGIRAQLGEIVDKDQRESGEREVDEKTRKEKAGTLVTNFLDTASPKGAWQLKEYYRDRVRNEHGQFHNPPPHIRAAIDYLFPLPRSEPALRSPHVSAMIDEYSLENVNSNIQYKDSAGLEILGNKYKGIWDIIRYSAHEFDTGKSMDAPNPWVVRAAMEIGPVDVDAGRNEPWFRIHYKPREVRDLRISTGSIILINNGTHFCITGREHDTNAPIYVIAEFDRTPLSFARLSFFAGLVIRRHSKGRVFASRVSFVRSDATSLADLKDKIDVYEESELKRKFSKDIARLDFCLKQANNKVRNDGKCVLLL